MRKYTWSYGIFHWFMHYALTITLWWASGITIFPVYISATLLGVPWKASIVDYFIVIVISSLIDLDHLPLLKKFGFRRYTFGAKRFVAPLHNFFFLSFLGILSAFTAIFISKDIAVIIFAVVLHMIWDIFEDVAIFRTSFRRWEKTWGLNTQDLEQSYNELVQMEAQQPKKESKISKIKRMRATLKERSLKLRERSSKLREKIRRKKTVTTTATTTIS